MAQIETRLKTRGRVLPPPTRATPGVAQRFRCGPGVGQRALGDLDRIVAHGRSAVGMAELPFGIPVEIEAEVGWRP